MVLPLDIAERLRQYNDPRGIQILNMLGHGKDGFVVSGHHPSSPLFVNAEKVFIHPDVYRRERDAYVRLRECKVIREIGFNVPQLIDFDDRLAIVEMSVVSAPRILDFASVFLDFPQDFDEEQLQGYRENIAELFGDRAPDVFLLLDKLQNDYGIWYYDARPANIDVGAG